LQKTNFFIAILRVLRISTHTATGLSIAACVLPFVSLKDKQSLIKWWCKGLLRAFNIKVIIFGQLPPDNIQGAMFVANHVSWADTHALNTIIALRFIAKAEIKSWPIFGYLVNKTNALFIDRSKRHEAGRIVDIAAESLSANDNLCFFPEGTTTDGSLVLPFKSSVLQAAISAKSQVWPVAIRYVNSNGSINIDMAYAGDTTLLESMKNVLMQAKPVVELHFLLPINSVGENRRELSKTARDVIARKLDLI
jgi:1-acyl-sn-glycerol-3-phosphate acyltransferase